jgi:hypothetical protein
MSDALATCLHDRLAGAAYAIDLLENIRDQHKDPAPEASLELLFDVK